MLLDIIMVAFITCTVQQTIRTLITTRGSYPSTTPFEELCVSSVLARLAYKNEDEMNISSIEHITDHPKLVFAVNNCLGTNDIVFLQADSVCTQAYAWINADNQTAYVTFRGTESKDDILIDLDVSTRDFRGMGVKVHNGFRRQFNGIESELTYMLDKNKYSFEKIVFCGHSLGGGLATLAAVYYSNHFKGQNIAIHCHTFGSPRVGNAAFVKLYDKMHINSWRVFHYQDPVPMIPISFRFSHVNGHSLCLGKENTCTYKTADYCWLIRPFIALACLNLTSIATPHGIESYIKKLKSLTTAE